MDMHTSFHRTGVAGVLLTALITAGAGVAQAAPQALALVATKGAVELTCEGRACSAELTTFCLQSDRFSPIPGTVYHLANDDMIRLIGMGDDGRVVALDPEKFLRFESARTHLAVRVSVPRDRLAQHGVSRLEVVVGENVSLLPEAVAGDDDPMTEGEIAILTDSLRPVGSQIVDENGERMQAARITSRMINALPQHGTGGKAVGRELLHRSIGAIDPGNASPRAQDRARGAFDLCRFIMHRDRSVTMRRCLQKQHDDFIDFLNSEYWNAVKVGS